MIKLAENFIKNLECNHIKKIEENNSINDTVLLLFICSELLNQNSMIKYENEITYMINYSLGKLKSFNLNNITYRGLYSELGNLFFATNNIYNKTGELKTLKTSVNNLIIKEVEKHTKFIKQQPVKTFSYDLIYGSSGVLYCLLDDKDLIFEKRIESTIKYLIWLSEYRIYKNYETINFFIEEDEYMDLGLAHGILAPLIVLSKCKHLGLSYEGLDEAINRLFKIYKNYEIAHENSLIFPKKIRCGGKNNDIMNKSFENASWCYGNVGIIRGLMKVAYYMDWDDEYKYYKEHLVREINKPLELYNLETNVLCHGYTSVLTIQMSAYKETLDKRFLETLERNKSKTLEIHEKLLMKNHPYTKDELATEIRYSEDLFLLSGVGGVFLSLLFVNNDNMNFNKILMVD